MANPLGIWGYPQHNSLCLQGAADLDSDRAFDLFLSWPPQDLLLI